MQPRTTLCGLFRVQYTIPNYNIRIYTYNRPIATHTCMQLYVRHTYLVYKVDTSVSGVEGFVTMVHR